MKILRVFTVSSVLTVLFWMTSMPEMVWLNDQRSSTWPWFSTGPTPITMALHTMFWWALIPMTIALLIVTTTLNLKRGKPA
jgi:hypothetical protein